MTASTLDVPGARLHYQLEGPTGAPLIVLAGSLGTALAMWDAQIDALTKRFRVLRYDMRGHGASTVSTVPVDVARLAQDVLALLDAVEAPSAHLAGLSLGGMVGLWVAAHAPKRLDSLVLSNTGAAIGQRGAWDARIETAASRGMEAIANDVLDRWFSARFREREPQRVEPLRQILLSTSVSGYIAACRAIRDADLRETVALVEVPTLVIAGGLDVATPPAAGRWLAGHIQGARYVQLEVAHLSNVEAEIDWNESVIGFISEREGCHGRAETTG